MAKKVIIIMLGFFFTQLLVSCMWECPTPESYEINYNKAVIRPFNTAGFFNEYVVDTVYKNAFGLEVGLDFDVIQIAKASSHLSGFNTAYAWSNDCQGDTWTYNDPLSYMELFAINTETDVKVNVTSWFSIYGYAGEMMPFDEFFQHREEWQDGFQVELVKFDSIPNSTIFVIEAYLESGMMLTSETEKVDFY